MKLKRLVILTALAQFAAVCPLVLGRDFAQWVPDDGYPIRAGRHHEWFCSVERRDAGELTGEICIVWSDCRWTDTHLGDRAVYMQVIGVDGEPKFPQDGIRIVDLNNRQEDPQPWPARDGSWFVAWEDFDIDTTGDMYCVKINPEGERVWAADDPRGVPVCTYPRSAQEEARIVEDNEGGCIIAWRDWRSGLTDIYAQHILHDGTVDPDWPENGMPVVRRPGDQLNHTADSDGEGGMIIGWRDTRIINDPNIWAQRITPDGEPLWGQGEGIVVCGNNAAQDSPKLCPDGSHGAFFCWVDSRNTENSGKDIYAQRVGYDGNILWTADGDILCDAPNEQDGNRIVASWPGEAIVVWEDKREERNTTDVYSMRISGVNGMVREWNPAAGVLVSGADNNQKGVRLYPDGQGGAYYVWEDERNRGTPEIEIWGQRMSRLGAPSWESDGIPICLTAKYNNSAAVRTTADGGCVMVWGIGEKGDQGIDAQRLTPDGEALWAENGIPISGGISGNAINPKSVWGGDGMVITLWLDGRFSGVGEFPFIQYTCDAGDHPEFQLEEGGVPVLVGTIGGGVNADVAADGQGGAIVVWEDHRRSHIYSIYAQHMSAGGERLWGDSGLKAAEGGDYEQLMPAVCSDGNGGAYVAWKSDTDQLSINLFMQHLDRDGNRLWGDWGHRVTTHNMDDIIEHMMDDGQGGAVLVWQCQHDTTDDDLWAIRLDADHNDLWGDREGIILCNAENKQRNSQIIRHQLGFAVVWVDGRYSVPEEPDNDIFAQVITMDGEFLLEENGSSICDFQYHQDFPVLARDNHSNIWVAWEDYRYTGSERGRDIYIQKIRPNLRNGRVIKQFEVIGRAVCPAPGDQLKPAMVHDGYNGMWMVWVDFRNDWWYDIYGTHLNPDGVVYEAQAGVWDEQGNPVCLAYHDQLSPEIVSLTPVGTEGIVAVWNDMRATGKEFLFNLYTQRLSDGTRSVPGTPPPRPPAQYTLEEVYPNPFNSRALVVFSIRREGEVRINLYDAGGRFVSRVASGWWSAGQHRALIDGDRLSAGNYLLRLEAGGVRQELKVQLVK